MAAIIVLVVGCQPGKCVDKTNTQLVCFIDAHMFNNMLSYDLAATHLAMLYISVLAQWMHGCATASPGRLPSSYAWHGCATASPGRLP